MAHKIGHELVEDARLYLELFRHLIPMSVPSSSGSPAQLESYKAWTAPRVAKLIAIAAEF